MGPWASTNAEVTYMTDGSKEYVDQQAPILTDIVFAKSGNMTLGFIDRESIQFGISQYKPLSAQNDLVDREGGGDILHACLINGGWVIENTTTCATSDTGAGTDAALTTDGPSGAGEYYYGDYYSHARNDPTGDDGHDEISHGGLVYSPGDDQIISTAFDPITRSDGGNTNSQGVITFNSSGGDRVHGYQFSQIDELGKAGALGDLEAFCAPAPIEIGNFVWIDTNSDGVQDAGESAAVGVTIELYDASGNLLATAITDANGQYYFSDDATDDATWVTANDGVDYNTSYYIVAGGNGQYTGGVINLGGTDYELTSTDNATGGNADFIDSDGAIASGIDPDFDGEPYVQLTTGDAGNVHHAYDFGFRVPVSCTNPTVVAFAIQPSCVDGVAGNDGYLQLSSITGGDRYHWSTSNTFDDNGGANTYANATDLTGATYPLQFNTGLSNADVGDFTIRVYNGADDCFTDVVVTLNTQDCAEGCDCQEYLYSNDTDNDLVHKFLINPTDSTLIEVGNPWFEPINRPHGGVMDLNGVLYFAEKNDAATSSLFKIDCDGNFIDTLFYGDFDGTQFNNFVMEGNILYVNGAGGDYVKAYDICEERFIGTIDYCCGNLNWELFEGADGNMYTTDKVNDSLYIYNVPYDTSLYNGTVVLQPTFKLFDAAMADRNDWGVETDLSGNWYVVLHNNSFDTRVLKFDASGTKTGEIIDAVSDGVGFFDGRGVVWSEATDLLYVASDNDDCVAVIAANTMTYLSSLSIPGGGGKDLSLVKECCPTNNTVTIDTTLCTASLDDVIFLQDLIGCDGGICEGVWQEGGSNTGLTYDPCDNSVTITALDACGSFTLESDGTGNNPQCGAFKITVNINVASQPEATVFAIQPSCTDGMVNSDGYLQISEIVSGKRFNWSEGSTYSGDSDFANAIDTTGMSFPIQFATGRPNPSGSQDYTIRIFSDTTACGENCYTDYTVTMNEQDCTVGCDCTDNLYLNDPLGSNGGTNEIHKFRVQPDGSLLEIGSPWLAPTTPGGNEPLDRPHGIVTDLNGNVYIGSVEAFANQPGKIVKLNCDGDVLIDSIPGIDQFGYNIGVIDNQIYIPIISQDKIEVWDVCSGGQTINMTNLLGPGWGFTISNDKSSYYYTIGWLDNSTNKVVKGNTDGSGSETIIYDSGSTSGAYMGITQDNSGNLYVVESSEDGGFGDTRILKISSTGTLLATSAWDTNLTQTNGVTSGYHSARGIIWSPEANLLYVGSFEDCIAVFDTSLNYLPVLSVGYVNGSAPKGIGLSTECCPINNNITVDTTLCATSLNDQIFLSELINCNGSICEGMWQEGLSNSGLIYNSCDNSVTIDALDACGSFTLESDGTGNAPQCGAFKITVNIGVENISNNTISNDQVVCEGDNATSLTTTASSSSGTLIYQWQQSTTDCNSDFIDISSATTDTYDPGTVNQTTYYRLITSINGACTNGTCIDTSNCVTITYSEIPTATASITPSICTPEVSNDGTITLSNFNPGERFALEANSSYTGSATFSGSTAIPLDGIIVNNLANPSGTQEYTVRIFNNFECFVDYTLSLTETSCIDYPDYTQLGNPCSDPACHNISNDIHLGSSITPDNSDLSNENANMDSDEGVSIAPEMQFVPGNTVNFFISVYNNTGTDAYLRMWIDWNGDGDFEDTGEQVENNTYSSTGSIETIFVSVTIPTNAVQTQAIALRARLSTDDANSSDSCGNGNCAADGEVEDYLIQIECLPKICIPPTLTIRKGQN